MTHDVVIVTFKLYNLNNVIVGEMYIHIFVFDGFFLEYVIPNNHMSIHVHSPSLFRDPISVLLSAVMKNITNYKS